MRFKISFKENILLITILIFAIVSLSAYAIQNIFLIIFFLLSLLVFLNNRKPLNFSKASEYWLMICGINFVSSLLSFFYLPQYIDSLSLADALKTWFKLFFMMTFTIGIFSKNVDKSRLFRGIRDFVVICSVFGIAEKILDTKIFLWIYGVIPNSATVSRTSLFFGHPIYYGTVLCVGCLFLLYYPYKTKLTSTFCWFLLLMNLYFTEARSCWVALFISVVLELGLKRFSLKKRITKQGIFWLLIVCVCLLMALLVFSDNFRDIGIHIADLMQVFSKSDTSASRIIRLTNISKVLSFFFDSSNLRYLIIGGGSFFSQLYIENNPSMYGWTNAVDNQYLTICLNYGIVALILFIFIFIRSFKNFLRSDAIENRTASLTTVCLMISMFFYDCLGSIRFTSVIFIALLFMQNDYKEERQEINDYGWFKKTRIRRHKKICVGNIRRV